MNRFLPAVLLLGCLLPGLASAQIYSWVDAQGNVVFSDQKPPPGVTPRSVDLRPLPTVPAMPQGNEQPSAPPQAKAPEPAQPVLQIVSPRNEESIRANNGDVTVSMKVSPGLAASQVVRLYLDGVQVHEGHDMNVALSNLDRGKHELYAVIEDANGQVVSRTESVTFYLLRYSALFKKPAATTP